MLIALYTIFVLGGGGSGTLDFIADTSDTVKVVVENEESRKTALSTLKAMKKLSSNNDKAVKRASKELNAALESDDHAAIESAWDKILQQRRAYDNSMLDMRFELKDQLTREDWEAVFPST
jgi:hypothetical protein